MTSHFLEQMWNLAFQEIVRELESSFSSLLFISLRKYIFFFIIGFFIIRTLLISRLLCLIGCHKNPCKSIFFLLLMNYFFSFFFSKASGSISEMSRTRFLMVTGVYRIRVMCPFSSTSSPLRFLAFIV